MCEQVTRETELRKLSYNALHQIAANMNFGKNWQQLMMRIPKDLETIDFSLSNRDTPSMCSGKGLKYTNEHMQLIEEASGRSLKLPAHILFEEWGTSGRHRPTVGHLLHLLIEANLYRAADYVSTDILKGEVACSISHSDNKNSVISEDPTPRPVSGPAAPIDIDLSMLEGSLDSINLNLQSVVVNNNVVLSPPRMHSSSTNGQVAAITDLFDNEAMVTADENSNAPTLSTNLESDPIIEGLSGVSIPNLSVLQNAVQIINERSASDASYSSYPLPNSSVFDSGSVRSEYQSDVPNMSLFGGMNFAEVAHSNASSSTTDSSTSVSLRSDISASASSMGNSINNNHHSMLPQLSFLMNNAQVVLTDDFGASNNIPSIDSSTTRVEKFNFDHLLNCTDKFNDDDFTGVAATGRKLGAGGFGSVHLGVNLTTHIPLAAVKRLHKKEQQVRQKFDLEIRILSSHRHENLVQLLGYADDADEMCLVYEFVGGGNLERRLELCRNDKAILTIAKRLTIAVGVARAIEFLHRAELIHRDIKSANVLLTDADDHPKVSWGRSLATKIFPHSAGC